MRYLKVLILIISLNYNTYSQSFNGISLSAHYSSLVGGLKPEVSGTKSITNKILMNLRVKSDFKEMFGISGGISYRLYNKTIFPTIGIEYSYEKVFQKAPYPDYHSTNIEFPFQIGVKITPHISIFGGASTFFFISGYRPDNFINNMRLGMLYCW